MMSKKVNDTDYCIFLQNLSQQIAWETNSKNIKWNKEAIFKNLKKISYTD